MKKTFIKFFDKIIVILLFLTGVFSSCSKSESGDAPVKYGMIPLYGIEQAEFKVNENNDFEGIPKEIKSEDIEFEKQ
jgi:hypothetical protein